jgi:hypothetical protein
VTEDNEIARGAVAILRTCFELSEARDPALEKLFRPVLPAFKRRESEMALRQLIARIQSEADGAVDDGKCREAVQRIQLLV